MEFFNDRSVLSILIAGFLLGLTITYFSGFYILPSASGAWGPPEDGDDGDGDGPPDGPITSTTTLSCNPGDVCNTGNWQCDGDCRRERRIYEYDSSCNCDFDHWERENAPQGEHCSGGSFTSSGVCGYSGWSCDGNCRKRRHAYECDGSNNCDYHESWDKSNCPVDTVCSGGSCVADQACSTGSFECKNSCTKGKRQFRCDGSNNCNEFWRWTDEDSCDPYKCTAGSCTNVCESDCGASADCDGKNEGDSCKIGYECNANCMCEDVCFLNSASLETECMAGDSLYCEKDDKVNIYGNISTKCPSISHFQIDADSGTCSIKFSGGNMKGIYGNSPSRSSGTISGQWTIPSIPSQCKGQVFSIISARIYNGGDPNTGIELGSASISNKLSLTTGCIRVQGPYETVDQICG